MTLAGGSTESGASLPIWGQVLLTLVVATVPALIGWFAGRSDRKLAREAAAEAAADARGAQASAEELERLRRLEDRVREAKVDAYMPLIKTIGAMFESAAGERTKAQQAKLDQNFKDAMNTFWSKGLIYSSDQSQRAFARMMQAAYGDAPSTVALRLTSEFILSARRDLGDDRSETTPTEIWAPKLTDLFNSDNPVAGFDSLSFTELITREGWTPPWAGSALEHRPGELQPPASRGS